MYKRAKNLIHGSLIVLTVLNVFVWIAVFDLSQREFLEVNFFDVGQGDAIFIETPQGYQALIDGGPGSAILEKLGKEMPYWDRTIDLIILTHPEHDHIAGLIEVLKKYEVKQILWTGVERETYEYKEWKDLIEEEGAEIIIAQAGKKIFCSDEDTGQCYFDILYPFENLSGQMIKNVNNTSVVARLVFYENSFLFTGDAYKSVEQKLVDAEIYLSSDVLKVGHHGSKTSTLKEFVEYVSPSIAVIQCGKNNSYGHPYEETVSTLKEFDITILRTDLDGDIKIISDGRNFKIK